MVKVHSFGARLYMAASQRTKIELPTGKFNPTWHDEIFELPFLIQSPEKADLGIDYRSEMAPIGRDMKIGIEMKRTVESFGLYLVIEDVS